MFKCDSYVSSFFPRYLITCAVSLDDVRTSEPQVRKLLANARFKLLLFASPLCVVHMAKRLQALARDLRCFASASRRMKRRSIRGSYFSEAHQCMEHIRHPTRADVVRMVLDECGEHQRSALVVDSIIGLAPVRPNNRFVEHAFIIVIRGMGYEPAAPCRQRLGSDFANGNFGVVQKG